MLELRSVAYLSSSLHTICLSSLTCSLWFLLFSHGTERQIFPLQLAPVGSLASVVYTTFLPLIRQCEMALSLF